MQERNTHDRPSRMPNDRIERHDVHPHVASSPDTNVVEGSLWMIGITLVLFFLPAINGVIGGLVGGYKVGSVGRALAAAILPAIVASIGLWAIFALFQAPVIGFVAGSAVAILIALADVGIFLGAAIGGALGNSRRL